MGRCHPDVFKVKLAVTNAGHRYMYVYYEPQHTTSSLRIKFLHGHNTLSDEKKHQLDQAILQQLDYHRVDYISAGWAVNRKADVYYDYEFYVICIPWKIRKRKMGQKQDWYKD